MALRRLIFAGLASLISTLLVQPALAFANAVSIAFEAATNLVMLPFRYADGDAGTSLAADRLKREMDASTEDPNGSAFKSFLERALRHTRFVGRQFDPGTPAALAV